MAEGHETLCCQQLFETYKSYDHMQKIRPISQNFHKVIKDLKNIYDEIENSAAFQVWSDLIDLLPASPD